MESKTLIKKIAVIGPESTGKSTLCTQLAEHYNTRWVPEYAREYLEKNGTDYSFSDLYQIAKGQICNEENVIEQLSHRLRLQESEQVLIQQYQPVFLDTDLHVIKIWSEFVFNKCDNRILKLIAESDCDLFLLCDVDLPWVEDALREYPDIEIRTKLFHYYKEEMAAQEKPWAVVRGNYGERLEIAINEADRIVSLSDQ